VNLLKVCDMQLRVCLFTFRPIGLRQQFDNNQCFESRWSRGNASALDARGTGFDSRIWQGYYVLCLICVLFFVVVLHFCPKHIICHTIVKFLCNVNWFHIFNILHYLRPIISVSRYRTSIFDVRLNVVKRCKWYQFQYQYTSFIHQLSCRMQLVSIDDLVHNGSSSKLIQIL